MKFEEGKHKGDDNKVCDEEFYNLCSSPNSVNVLRSRTLKSDMHGESHNYMQDVGQVNRLKWKTWDI
jgi:hypothetical protein